MSRKIRQKEKQSRRKFSADFKAKVAIKALKVSSTIGADKEISASLKPDHFVEEEISGECKCAIREGQEHFGYGENREGEGMILQRTRRIVQALQ